MISGALAAYLGVLYIPLFRGFWMLAWFDSRQQRNEFMRRYYKILNWAIAASESPQ